MSRLNMNGGGFQTPFNLNPYNNPWINSNFNWMDLQQFNTEDVTNNFDATSDYSKYFEEQQKAQQVGQGIAQFGQGLADNAQKYLQDYNKKDNSYSWLLNDKDKALLEQKEKINKMDLSKYDLGDPNVNAFNERANNRGTPEQSNNTGSQIAAIAGEVANGLDLSTGNKQVDNGIQSAVGNIADKGLNGGSLLDTGISVANGMLGTSDNSVVRAGGQLIGQSKNIVNSIKGIKSANTAIKTAKNIKDATKAGKALQAAKAAKLTNVANLAGIGASVADTALFGNQIPTEYQGVKGGITQGLDTAYDAIEAGVSVIPGIGTLAGAIMAGNKLLGHGVKAMGGGTDGMTTTDAILGSTFLQATPIGMINGFGGKSTSAFTKDTDIFTNIGGSYLGSNALADEVEPYAGKKFGWFSSSSQKKYENKIQEMIRQQNILRNISNESERVKTLQQTMTGAEAQSLNNLLNGGYRDITFSKKGGILDSLKGKLDRARIIIETKKTIVIEPVEEKEETKNVIPEGALHANLHHMDLDNITKKGVPVIDNEGDQQAEIERDEIIFRLEVTKLIEEFKKDGSDEAAIKAGKLLTEEILYNTEDRTGLLEKFKQGGEIQIAQEGTKLNPKSIVDFDSFQKYLKET